MILVQITATEACDFGLDDYLTRAGLRLRKLAGFDVAVDQADHKVAAREGRRAGEQFGVGFGKGVVVRHVREV